MSVEGLEPSTNGLKGHCSAIELHARTATDIIHEFWNSPEIRV